MPLSRKINLRVLTDVKNTENARKCIMVYSIHDQIHPDVVADLSHISRFVSMDESLVHSFERIFLSRLRYWTFAQEFRWKKRKKTCLIAVKVCALQHASRLRDVCTPSWVAALYIFHGSTRLGTLHAFFTTWTTWVRGKLWPINQPFFTVPWSLDIRCIVSRSNDAFRFIDRDPLPHCSCLRGGWTRSGKDAFVCHPCHLIILAILHPIAK